MRRPAVTPLVENPAALPAGARVIDAEFQEVRGATLWASVKRYLAALLAAAVIGALAPPTWMLVAGLVEAITR